LDGSHHSSDATISHSEENESVILLGNLRLRVTLLMYAEFRGLAEFRTIDGPLVTQFTLIAVTLALTTSMLLLRSSVKLNQVAV
jgi:hypothetical protein